jgi:hypothetical protein
MTMASSTLTWRAPRCWAPAPLVWVPIGATQDPVPWRRMAPRRGQLQRLPVRHMFRSPLGLFLSVHSFQATEGQCNCLAGKSTTPVYTRSTSTVILSMDWKRSLNRQSAKRLQYILEVHTQAVYTITQKVEITENTTFVWDEWIHLKVIVLLY